MELERHLSSHLIAFASRSTRWMPWNVASQYQWLSCPSNQELYDSGRQSHALVIECERSARNTAPPSQMRVASHRTRPRGRISNSPPPPPSLISGRCHDASQHTHRAIDNHVSARVNGRKQVGGIPLAYLKQIGCFEPMSSHVCSDEVQNLYRYLSASLLMLRYQSLSVEGRSATAGRAP
jgi:hypothetical protein